MTAARTSTPAPISVYTDRPDFIELRTANRVGAVIRKTTADGLYKVIVVMHRLRHGCAIAELLSKQEELRGPAGIDYSMQHARKKLVQRLRRAEAAIARRTAAGAAK